MRTPIGVMLEIGQKWRVGNPRVDRVVTVTGWDQGRECVKIGSRWARLKRFNGKRSGYILVDLVLPLS